jgi:hypothetical protein
MVGVEDSTERDVSLESRELVAKKGTAVVFSGEATVAKAVASTEDKEPVGVVDKGPSSLVEAKRIEVVSMEDVVRHMRQAQEA